MENLFLEYPKCSTCRKAKRWLEDNNVNFIDRHIVENNPTKEELSNWIKRSSLDIKKFFNTSGLLYKSMDLKNKLNNMTYDEKVNLLSSNGMLVKRPLIINEDFVLVGFKENEWKEKLLN